MCDFVGPEIIYIESYESVDIGLKNLLNRNNIKNYPVLMFIKSDWSDMEIIND